MVPLTPGWATKIAKLTTKRPWWVLLVVIILTLIAGAASENVQLRLNFSDLLPEHNQTAVRYRQIQNEFTEASIIVVLEGERDRITELADRIEPVIANVEGVHHVDGKLPTDYMANHGFVLMKPKDFERMLRVFDDPSLLGVLRGFNDDYEREYTDDEGNLRRDELQIAQSLLGLTRSLEVLEGNLTGSEDAPPMEEAVQTMVLGEPWQLSLDRNMLMFAVYPKANTFREVDLTLETLADIRNAIEPIEAEFPDAKVYFTGITPIGEAEMNSVSTYTEILTLVALILIYLLIARSFRGWVLPLLGMIPLVVGIIWTTGLITAVFGSMNMFTMMMGIVLLGLGIDFIIHLLSRYTEERCQGADLETSIVMTIGDTGKGVLTGGMTTAAAFFALMIADTKGVYEFGFAAGSGVILTLVAVFLTLPALLTIRERILARRGRQIRYSAQAKEGMPWIGAMSGMVWKRYIPVLIAFVLLAAFSVWAALNTAFEYDFMELEPQHEPAVQLQRILPKRFGTSDQAGWVVANSVEEARQLKEDLRDLPSIGQVLTISDFLPAPERLTDYETQLKKSRAGWELAGRQPVKTPKASELAVEIDRLWDNLDLMSNLAYQAGIDRVVKVIDGMTGYDSETDSVDEQALLPRLNRLLKVNLEVKNARHTAVRWRNAMIPLLISMSNTDAVSIDDLPSVAKTSFLPRNGSAEGPFLVYATPRKYAWTREAVNRFLDQTKPIAPEMVSNPEIFIVMTDETLRDGMNGALLALAVIIVLLLIHFRGPMGLLATIPLIGSTLFMLAAMHLLGMKYNYVNLIAVPIILGIGIDDGVHALHRWRNEAGDGVIRVKYSYSMVGRAILLTSLTTMIGFGSIGLYSMPGMASFGIVLFMGVGFCFLATLLVLPAVMRLFLRNRENGKMKKNGAVASTITGLLLLSLLLPTVSSAQTDITGEEWLKRIDSAEEVETAYSVFRQTITTSTGSERTLEAKSWSTDGGDVSLMVYTAPARVAGDKILQREGGDQIWYYMKRRDVTRHFVGSARKQSAMGSDFSYEDLASGEMTEDYTAEVLDYEKIDGVECVKLKCTPTESGPSYDHIILWAGVEDALTRKIDYYDDKGFLKTLTVTNFEEIEGRYMGLSFLMENVREGSHTFIEQDEMTFKVTPDPQMFSKSALTSEIR